MTIEIKVGPPVITISQGRTFIITDKRGCIMENSEQGAYAADTRFISTYELFINHTPWELINSSALNFYTARYQLTNTEITLAEGKIAPHTIGLTLTRQVNKGIHEEFEIMNYSGKKISFVLELELHSDFADIAEVRTKKIIQRGEQETQWHAKTRQLRTIYKHKDYHRAATYQVTHTTSPVNYANGRLCFEIELDSQSRWQACGDLILEHGQHIQKPPLEVCRYAPKKTPPTNAFAEKIAHWRTRCSKISTPDNTLYRMYNQAITNMAALRMYDKDVSDEAWVPAAGMPWFVTLFGRDALITSYQNMIVSPGFAYGTLQRLAEHQATKRDDWLDAQPGKIMHEIRFGEHAHFHTKPISPYYGTADATILYLIVLSETYRWTGDLGLLKKYRKVAENCLYWIDHYGDLDGDGFQEYKTFSTASPAHQNMGWKDADHAVVYADGSQVKQPKGTVELQAYVYDAKIRMAEIFQALGDDKRAQALLHQAQTLQYHFHKVFWMEDEGCFAFGLDPEKRQITTITSNAGQCLWGGIVYQEYAERTARRLLQEDMWSGWGIRTLSSQNPSYNPYTYHLGSVWPHDNGIIAAGFKHYGLVQEANQVIRGILDAIDRFDAYRPPEVFAGIQRNGEEDFPVLYPSGANIPQAWATGSIFHMLRTILGLRADAPHKRLYVNPTLPEWLPEIEIQHLRVGPCLLSLRCWREGEVSRWEVREITSEHHLAQKDMIQVMDEPNISHFPSPAHLLSRR